MTTFYHQLVSDLTIEEVARRAETLRCDPSDLPHSEFRAASRRAERKARSQLRTAQAIEDQRNDRI